MSEQLARIVRALLVLCSKICHDLPWGSEKSKAKTSDILYVLLRISFSVKAVETSDCGDRQLWKNSHWQHKKFGFFWTKEQLLTPVGKTYSSWTFPTATQLVMPIKSIFTRHIIPATASLAVAYSLIGIQLKSLLWQVSHLVIPSLTFCWKMMSK